MCPVQTFELHDLTGLCVPLTDVAGVLAVKSIPSFCLVYHVAAVQ